MPNPHAGGRSNPRKALLSAVAAIAMAVPGETRAQQPATAPASAAKMTFDVASVRENNEGMPPSGPRPQSNFPLGPGAMYSPNGGTFSATNYPLWFYLMFAYKMTDHEVEALRKQLPDWALDTQFDIHAKTEKHDASKDEMRLMMQSLLAERFKLTVHTTTEEVPVYAMVLAKPGKPGPKLRPHPVDGTSCSNAPPAAPAPDAVPAPDPPRTVEGGFPVICGGAAGVPASVPGRIAVGYRNVPLSLIALQLTGIGALDRPVIDRTGLTGKWDFVVEFTPEIPAGANPGNFHPDDSGPPFQVALAEQDGLKLVSQKGLVDVIKVDHIERLADN